MKAKLTTEIAQHVARLTEPVVGDSRQLTCKTKTIMKTTSAQLIPVIALVCSALLYFVTGCSRAPEAPPKEVTIQADDKMRYDVTAFDASPGQKIAVTIKNIGTTPKFSMGHNFVMLDRVINTGNIQSAFLDKASTEASHDYVPPDAKEVLAHSKLLGPGESEVVYLQRALHPGRIPLCLLVPRPLFTGNQGCHDSEITIANRKIVYEAKYYDSHAITLVVALGFTSCGKQTGTSQAERTANAVASYVAPGEKDEYYLFYSGGHSGQVFVAGIPSLRHISTIPGLRAVPGHRLRI